MHIQERRDTGFSLEALAGAVRPTAARSAGCHVSTCVRAIMERIDPKTYGLTTEGQPDADTLNRWYVGYLWEELFTFVLSRARVEQVDLIRAWEIQRDHIFGTPDWFEFDDAGLIVSDTKATWKSAREFDLLDPKFVGWLFQLRAYAYMLGTDRAVLYVLFMNDDYTRYVPRVRVYDLRFTERELVENWAQLTGIAKKRGWLS